MRRRDSAAATLLLFFILFCCRVDSFVDPFTTARLRLPASSSPTAVFNFRDEADREEQFRLQQEILAKRRNPRAKEEELKKIEARRKEASAEVTKTMWAKNSDPTKDNLEEWKKALANGDVKDLGYTPTPPKSASLFGVSIPLVMSPIDVPQYDNGQRFDLRLPYAERGYEDADADVMGKVGNFFGSLFGGGKKSEKPEEPPSPPKKSK